MKKRFSAVVLITLFLLPAATAGVEFDDYFTSGSLRIDLYHSGAKDTEFYSVDRIIREKHWGGNPNSLIDTMNLGEYIFFVFDLDTNNLIFSRGFCNLYGEWAVTDMAGTSPPAVFHETIRFPIPAKPVQVKISRRNRENIFENIASFVVDPSDYHVRDERKYQYFRRRALIDNGDPSEKVDICIIGDGYRSDQVHKLREDAERLVNELFSVEPFRSRKDDFNVRLVESVSEEAGVDDPREKVYRDNLLELTFNSLELDRYMIEANNRVVHDIAARVPYDRIILIANEDKYGGGGIFNFYCSCTTDNEYSGYVFVHEFGHCFAGLADEYYSSEVTYNDEMYPRGVEPWEPNITAFTQRDKIKWAGLIGDDTPVPTPDDSTYAGVTGLFEGAGYSAKGLYRSSRDCIMLSKTMEFCPACRRAINRMIDFQTD
ncbi:MAG: peptidase M64 [Candidatus Latescibacteria bacterium]|nr:peptidase M64 [bacterium]MBD3423060.1 peptidase M64 [Candidatus Latescibacterota bacterium]